MALMTMLDIAKANGSDGSVGLIDETSKAHPELTGKIMVGGKELVLPNVGGARTITGLGYKTLVLVGLPTVGFRNGNQGTASTKAVYENRWVETFIMNPRWGVDCAIADKHEDGPAAALAMQAPPHMEAAFQTVGRQFYYGVGSGGDALGHPGLLASIASNMTIDAGGTTDSTCSSVYFVKFGPQAVQWVFGANGQFKLSDVDIRNMKDANNNEYSGFHQELFCYPGLQIGGPRCAVRIKKLTEEANKGLTDDLLADALALFEVGVVPDVIFMTRRSRKQLQKSRTATNATGSPAPTPAEYEGIPIAVTDSILNTETLAL